MNEPSEERPWNEEQWERFMQRSEVRSAKFGELLETLRDDPDRDALIAREMGWQLGEPAAADAPDVPELECDAPEDEPEDWAELDDSLHAIPAYAQGEEWSLRIHDALEQYLEGQTEMEPDDPLMVAVSDSMVVAAKIAGGHGMGYDDEVLCANIVCCRYALEAAERSVAALEELAERGTVPAEIVQPLLTEGREVRSVVARHIAELRSRVWW